MYQLKQRKRHKYKLDNGRTPTYPSIAHSSGHTKSADSNPNFIHRNHNCASFILQQRKYRWRTFIPVGTSIQICERIYPRGERFPQGSRVNAEAEIGPCLCRSIPCFQLCTSGSYSSSAALFSLPLLLFKTKVNTSRGCVKYRPAYSATPIRNPFPPLNSMNWRLIVRQVSSRCCG